MSGNAIDKAEIAIAAILRQLEKETDMVIDAVGINDIDVTNMDSRHTEWVRHFYIEMKRLPATHWGQVQ